MRSRPRTAADAVSHNAALKGKAKLAKLWADTANGTLESELAAGKTQSDAEGTAIATANKGGTAKLKGRGRERPSARHRGPGSPEVRGRGSEVGSDLRRPHRAGQLSPGSIDRLGRQMHTP